MVKFIPSEATYEIRLDVLRKGKSIESVMFADDLNPGSFHLGYFLNGYLVSVASFSEREKPEFVALKSAKSYQLRGMATREEFQGKGYGKEIIEEAEKILMAIDCSLLWFNARSTAVKFYEKSGYNTYGKEFMIPDVCKHYLMAKPLSESL